MHFEEGRVQTGLECAGLQTCRPAVLLARDDKRAQMKGFVLAGNTTSFLRRLCWGRLQRYRFPTVTSGYCHTQV